MRGASGSRRRGTGSASWQDVNGAIGTARMRHEIPVFDVPEKGRLPVDKGLRGLAALVQRDVGLRSAKGRA